jgi:hypothetical protein
MAAKNTSQAHDPTPGALAATMTTPRTLRDLYRECRSECWVAVAVVVAAVLIALSQSRREPQHIDQPRAVYLGDHGRR